jgi:hypothetical protein
MKLLAWGWIVSLFVLPEMISTSLIPYSKVSLQFDLRNCSRSGELDGEDTTNVFANDLDRFSVLFFFAVRRSMVV